MVRSSTLTAAMLCTALSVGSAFASEYRYATRAWCYVDLPQVGLIPTNSCAAASVVSGDEGYVDYETKLAYSVRQASDGRLNLRFAWMYSRLRDPGSPLFYCRHDLCKELPESHEIRSDHYGQTATICVQFSDVYRDREDLIHHRIDRKRPHQQCHVVPASQGESTLDLEVWDEKDEFETSFQVWIDTPPPQLRNDRVGDQAAYRARFVAGLTLNGAVGANLVSTRFAQGDPSVAGGPGILAFMGVRVAQWLSVEGAVGYQFTFTNAELVLLPQVTLYPSDAVRLSFGGGMTYGNDHLYQVWFPTRWGAAVRLAATFAPNLQDDDLLHLTVGPFVLALHSWEYEARWVLLAGLELGFGN